MRNKSVVVELATGRSRVTSGGWALRVGAEALSEAGVGSMDVEDPKLAIARVPKP
jgi:hypothetical protein